MNPKSYTPIAVDIAKETLEICEGGKKTRSLKYDKKGIQTLVKIAQKTRDPLVVFESTGGYERRLQNALHKASVPLCLVNAAWIRSFAQSEGVKAKTDPVDAQVIWRFAQEKQLEATPELPSERLALRDLLDRRNQLVENIKEEKSRRDTSSPMQRQSIENHLKFLNKEIEAIEAQIRRLTRESKSLKEQAEAITTVEGVGEVTAWTILAYLVELADVKRNQAVALAGLAPYNRDSGKTFKPRCIQGGRAKIRRCLYMAAMSAVKHNEHLKTYYERLVKAGKVKKVALVAVMRKLLIHIRALLINHKNVVAV